jgi:hypothetical protein
LASAFAYIDQPITISNGSVVRVSYEVVSNTSPSGNLALSNGGFTNATVFITDTVGTFLWGAQLEAGSFPTSYISTSGAAASRSADVASIPTSAFGYNADKGTVVVDIPQRPHQIHPVLPTKAYERPATGVDQLMDDIIKTDFYIKLPSEADMPTALAAFYRQDMHHCS